MPTIGEWGRSARRAEGVGGDGPRSSCGRGVARDMRRACVLLAAALLASPTPATQHPGTGKPGGTMSTETVTLLHTNDLHGHAESWEGWEGELEGKLVGGLDRLATAVRRERAAAGPERTLLLDAGDTVSDTMLAAETRGRVVLEAMNAIGYDAMVVGNHDVDFTIDVLREHARLARFPLLAANLVTVPGDRPVVRPYVIRSVGSVRVGILGLAYPNTPLTTARKNVEGVRFEDAVAAARRHVPEMRSSGVELLIVLSHLGLGADKALAERVGGIDVIVGGHSHNRMSEAERVGGTLIVQAGAHGSDLGRIDLTLENGRVVAHRRALVPVVGFEPDPSVAAIIARHRRPLADRMAERIAVARGPIVRAQTIAGTRSEPRDAQSPADSLFADAIRELTRADLAFLPGLGYGVAVGPGAVTASGLRNLLPHETPVWTMTLTGADVREVLEQAVENFSAEDPARRVGGVIQVSGLRFVYDRAAPRGQRVLEVVVAGKPLEDSARYTTAVNGLLAEGGHNYAAFARGEHRRRVGDLYEMVRGWLAARGQVSAPSDARVVARTDGKT